MSDEPRYTRAEWEEIQWQEDRESERRARKAGHLHGLVVLTRHEMDRNPSREMIADLLRVKCEQVRRAMLRAWDKVQAGQ
jgi:hypothetical protein